MPKIKPKVALITGAASGIGKAIVKKCLSENMKVVLVDNNEKKLSLLMTELNQPDSTLAITADISLHNQFKNIAETTCERFQEIHYLFNNAGIAGPISAIWEQSPDDFERVLDINLIGTYNAISTCVPIMLAQGEGGHIINTTAGAGLLTGPGLAAYKASKHALIAISEVLLADLKQINSAINVSVLIPHWVNTDIPTSLVAVNQQIIDDHRSHLATFGMPPELAVEILFEGIKENKFYIFTHPETHLPKIKLRMEGIMGLENPY